MAKRLLPSEGLIDIAKEISGLNGLGFVFVHRNEDVSRRSANIYSELVARVAKELYGGDVRASCCFPACPRQEQILNEKNLQRVHILPGNSVYGIIKPDMRILLCGDNRFLGRTQKYDYVVEGVTSEFIRDISVNYV